MSWTICFIFFFVGLSFLMSLIPEWIIMTSGFFFSISLMWSTMSFVAQFGCRLIFTLWSFEIPLSAKSFVLESPTIKPFFLSAITFSSLVNLSYFLVTYKYLLTSTTGFFSLDVCDWYIHLGRDASVTLFFWLESNLLSSVNLGGVDNFGK